MLSDEEMKALKIVNKRTERLIEELKIEEEDLIDEPKIAYLITQIEANKTLVNLIEKQSKEIEELKEIKFENERTIELFIEGYKRIYKELDIKSLIMNENILINEIKENFTSNDKIKARIEELKEDIKYSANPLSIDNSKFAIKVLQSLLEKE